VHHNNNGYEDKDKESRASVDLPAPSDGQGLPLKDEQHNEDEQYHVHFEKKMKVGSHVPCKKKSVNSIVSTCHKPWYWCDPYPS
jgi:hypothetical protein